MTVTLPTFDLRTADTRGQTEIGWLHSRHSFSFGSYHDPARTSFGSLRVLNDDVVEPGQGFGEHPHRDMEIVTWVIDGSLKHGDSLGNMKELRPGELQAMTAGTGIVHSEYNASSSDTVHFLQIWLMPRSRGVTPRYDQREFSAEGRSNQWQLIAGDENRVEGQTMPLDTDAMLSVADVAQGQSVSLTTDSGRRGYLHVVTGQVTVGEQTLSAGDAVAWQEEASFDITAASDAQVLWFDLG